MNTKTRSIIEPAREETVSFSRFNPPLDEAPLANEDHTFVWPAFSKLFEVMTPNSEGSRKSWKNFEHYKCLPVTSRPTSVPMYTKKWYSKHFVGQLKDARAAYRLEKVGGHLDPYGNAGKLNSGLPVLYEVRSDGGFVPAPALLDELVSWSLKTMLPSVKEDLSLINSIIELKDFKSLPQTIRNARNFLSGLLAYGRKFYQLTTRRIAGSTAGSVLLSEFAVRPLIADVISTYRALTRVDKRLNDLITRSGRMRKQHFCYRYMEFPDVDEVSPEYGWPEDPLILSSRHNYGLQRQVRNEATIFHAQIEYNYNYTQYQIQNAGLLGLLDRFGVNLNPSIVWNAIPWTFVIDWLVGVSRWLDQFKTQNMEPTVNIRRYLWSVSRKRTIMVRRVYSSNPDSLPDMGHVPIPVVHESSYRRHVELPGMAALLGSGLTLRELSLGAALVTARARRSPRKFRLPM